MIESVYVGFLYMSTEKTVHISVNCQVQEVYAASCFLFYGEVKLWSDVIKVVEEVLYICFPLIVYYE